MVLYAVAASALGAPPFGPTGAHAPDNWPHPYDKDATAFATNVGQLQSAINAAPEAGVIEYTGSLAGTAGSHIHLTTPGTWASRDVGVLVRAPLGSRIPIGYADVKGHNLIVSGDVTGTLATFSTNNTIQGAHSNKVWFWRCAAMSGSVLWNKAGGAYGGLCEVVHAKRGYNTGGDQVDVYANGTTDSIGEQVVGCYFAGKIGGVGPVMAHLGEQDNVGNGDLTVTATAGGTATAMFFSMRNTPVGSSATATVNLNGTDLWSGTIPDATSAAGDIQDFASFGGHALPRPFTQAVGVGDTITVTLTDVDVPGSGTFPHLDFWLGATDANHVDTLQFGQAFGGAGVVNSGRVKGATVRDTVLAGSNGEGVQFNYADGTFEVINTWLGKCNGQAAGLNPSGLIGPQAGTAPRLSLVNVQSPQGLGRLSAASGIHYTAPWLADVVNCTVNTTFPADFPASNRTGAALLNTPPTCADLASIWPECPPTGWQN